VVEVEAAIMTYLHIRDTSKVKLRREKKERQRREGDRRREKKGRWRGNQSKSKFDSSLPPLLLETC